MIEEISDTAPGSLAQFDMIIDARSPGEFAQDHIPNSINLPVLDDEERAFVGKIYVQDDPFRARKLGAALVSRNIARHLETFLAGFGGAWRPLIYCWRGGQRSHSMATVLSQVGWRAGVLSGGYKTYRARVVRRLYGLEAELPALVLLAGGTGVGKTDVIALLRDCAVQVIDLEALAEHRGSLLGRVGDQPSQKMFESRLAAAIERLDPSRPLIVEAESSRIGQITLPPTLWAAMSRAPSIVLEAPLAARIARLLQVYGAALNRGEMEKALERLPRHIGREEITELQSRLAAGDLHTVVQRLIEQHYDPSYRRSHHRSGQAILRTLSTGDGLPGELGRVAAEVCAVLAHIRAV